MPKSYQRVAGSSQLRLAPLPKLDEQKIEMQFLQRRRKTKRKRDEDLCISDGTVRSVGNKLLVLVEGTLVGKLQERQ